MDIQTETLTAECGSLQEVMNMITSLMVEAYKRDSEMKLTIAIPRGGVVPRYSPAEIRKCPYTYSKGKNKGKTCGGTCPAGKTQCSAHQRSPNIEPLYQSIYDNRQQVAFPIKI